MTFTAPLGLLALLAVPAVLLLHLFRRRLPQRRVAGLFLWSGQRLAAAAGRRRARLLHSASLWLELLAALCAALWLAGPVLGGGAVRHLVVVLDDHASLGALVDGTGDGTSVRDRAVAAVTERTAALAAADRVTLLRTGPRPEVLLGPAALPAEADGALARWQPRQPGHDPLGTLDFARELAGATGEVVWCTDRQKPAAGPGVEVVALGAPRPNAALGAIRRHPVEGGEELRVRVLGLGGIAATTLRVDAAGRELLRREIAFAGGPVEVAAQLPPGTGELRLRLAAAADALAIDDEAWSLPAPVRRVLVCDLLPAEMRAALELGRALAAQRDWSPEVDPAAAQLVLARAPGRLRAGQVELCVQPGDGAREAWVGPFVIDRGHPLMDGVQLEGVAWVSGGAKLPGRLLVAAGTRVLCSEEEDGGGGRRVWLGLAPGAGNFARAPDWPILLANLLELARDEVPGVVDVEVPLGAEARYRRSLVAAAADTAPELVAPDGTRTAGQGLRTVGWLPRMPGRHSVRDRDDREIGAFAVRFVDAAVSDLSAAGSGIVPARERPAAAAGARPEGDLERRLLALLLALLVLADWWLLGRR